VLANGCMIRWYCKLLGKYNRMQLNKSFESYLKLYARENSNDQEGMLLLLLHYTIVIY
jgi:hypothetical protein